MKVSEVNITPIKPTNGLIAFASVVVEGSLYLGSLGVHSRLNGTYRITYPTKRLGSKELSLYHPINQATGRVIEDAVIAKCQELFEGCDEDDRYSKAGYQARQTPNIKS